MTSKVTVTGVSLDAVGEPLSVKWGSVEELESARHTNHDRRKPRVSGFLDPYASDNEQRDPTVFAAFANSLG